MRRTLIPHKFIQQNKSVVRIININKVAIFLYLQPLMKTKKYMTGAKKLTVCFLFAAICYFSNRSFAQIVNMESQRYHKDTTGWSGSVSASLSFNKYEQQVFAVNADTHVQYQTKKSLYLLLGSYGFLKGNDQAFIDYGFLHFRYNYKIGPVLRWEAFTQLQENAITKIQSRFLIGTGPRFKIISNKKFHLYAASLVMLETEKETGVPQQVNDWRSSSYISFTFLPNNRTEFTSTTYYQPVLFDVADYRLLNQSVFKIKASNKISVNINWSYQFDSSPPPDVINETYNFSTGVELDL